MRKKWSCLFFEECMAWAIACEGRIPFVGNFAHGLAFEQDANRDACGDLGDDQGLLNLRTVELVNVDQDFFIGRVDRLGQKRLRVVRREAELDREGLGLRTS